MNFTRGLLVSLLSIAGVLILPLVSQAQGGAPVTFSAISPSLSGGAQLVATYVGPAPSTGSGYTGLRFLETSPGARGLVIDGSVLSPQGRVQLAVTDGRGNLVPGHQIALGDSRLVSPSGNTLDLPVSTWQKNAASGSYETVQVLDASGNPVYEGRLHTGVPSGAKPVGVVTVPAPLASGSGAGAGGGTGGSGGGGGGGGGAAGPIVPCGVGAGAKPCTLQQLVTLGVNIFNWLLAIGGATALLAVIVAGIRYLTAVLQGADSSAIAGAKQSLTYAIVGLVVMLTAVVIVRTVTSTLDLRKDLGPGAEELGDLLP